ncbi:MAG: hypothetical protein PHP32_00055 [Candidatus Izemoplasmatales bacterium]|nr:hypothetical protein [Candidatus Izemoplasmatales bacterium]
MKHYLFLAFLFVMSFSLMGCFSFADAETGYLEQGFTETENIPSGYEDLFSSIDEARILYVVHNFTTGNATALIIEFQTKNDLNDMLQNNEVFQTAISSWDQTEIIQDTYVLIPIAETASVENWLIRIFLGTTDELEG